MSMKGPEMPPISPDSPHYLFDPNSIGWLHRKVSKGEPIKAADLARIGEADRAVFADRLYQEQALLALSGKLPKRRGRKPEDPVRWWMTCAAEPWIRDRAAEILAERAGVKVRSDKEPREQAADEVAQHMCWNISGKALLNRISDMKKPRA